MANQAPRFRYMEAILYEEPRVSDIPSERWAYIFHDRDVSADGTPARPHYHLLMEFKNARTFKGVASDLGIEENFVEKVKNLTAARAYLTHSNAPDKKPYELSEVIANYDFENADKPLHFTTIYQLIEISPTFQAFVQNITEYNIPQNLSNYSMLLNIWQRSKSMDNSER